MSSTPLRWISAFLLACTGLYAGPATPADAPRGISRAELRPFAFASKETYVLGEPVYLRIILANASAERTYVVSGNWHPANDLQINIARGREMPRRYTAGVKDRWAPAATYRIRPYKLIAQRWTLCYDPDRPTGFAFDEAGPYMIETRVRITVDNRPLDLNLGRIGIGVTEPTPRQQEILKRIMRPECAADLQNRRARRETLAIWEEVARRYSNSVWGPHAKLLVAQYHLREGTEDYRKLVSRFEAITREYPDFFLLDDVYYGVAAAYDRAGQSLNALDWLNRLQRKFTLTNRIREGDPLFQKYIFRKQWEGRYTPWYLKE